MTLRIIQFVLFALAWECIYGNDSKHPSCKLWQNMARQLSTQQQKQMTCFANETNPCTALRCSGTYKYSSWIMPHSEQIEIDYCFGMRLNHCDQPVSMDVYLVVPDRNIYYSHRISHNTQLQIPGLSFKVQHLGAVEGFLYFYMMRNGSTVNLQITAKVRITARGRLVMWPASMQKPIVPMETIDVPPCSKKDLLTTPPPPLKEIGKCHPPTWHQPTYKPNVPTTTLNPVVTAHSHSATYNKSCSEGTLLCGELESCNIVLKRCVCRPDFKYNPITKSCGSKTSYWKPCELNDDCTGVQEVCKSFKCACADGYKFQRFRQMCLPRTTGVPTTRRPHVTEGPGHSVTSQPNSKGPVAAPAPNTTAIIAGSVVGGVVLIAFVVMVIFFLVRRSRRPYENREMLLANDDSDVIM